MRFTPGPGRRRSLPADRPVATCRGGCERALGQQLPVRRAGQRRQRPHARLRRAPAHRWRSTSRRAAVNGSADPAARAGVQAEHRRRPGVARGPGGPPARRDGRARCAPPTRTSSSRAGRRPVHRVERPRRSCRRPTPSCSSPTTTHSISTRSPGMRGSSWTAVIVLGGRRWSTYDTNTAANPGSARRHAARSHGRALTRRRLEAEATDDDAERHFPSRERAASGPHGPRHSRTCWFGSFRSSCWPWCRLPGVSVTTEHYVGSRYAIGCGRPGACSAATWIRAADLDRRRAMTARRWSRSTRDGGGGRDLG